MIREKSSIEHRLYREEDRGSLRFYQLSKELLHNDRYEKLSSGAILLYSVLFDRLQLSISNNRKDERGRYFLNFKVKPAQGDLRLRKEKPQGDRSLTEVLRANAKTITKYKKELREAELLLEEKPGLGRVSRLYLAKPEAPGDIPPPQTTPKTPPRDDITSPTEVTELPPNDTDLTKTYPNDTDCSEIHPSKAHESHKENSQVSNSIQKPVGETEGRGIHDQLHQFLQERYGRELLGEAIAIIKRRSVSSFGYEKYLTKILEDLTGRKKSQENFQPSPRVVTQPQPRPPTSGAATATAKKSYHLRESRYRDLSEDVLNARIEAKMRRPANAATGLQGSVI